MQNLGVSLNRAEIWFLRAVFTTMALFCLLALMMIAVPTTVIQVADVAAILASWSAIGLAGGLVHATAHKQVKLEFVLAIIVVIVSYLYLDHIYHEMFLEAKAAATAKQ